MENYRKSYQFLSIINHQAIKNYQNCYSALICGKISKVSTFEILKEQVVSRMW